jgi:hypothetical protein
MQTIRLNIDALNVKSFATAGKHALENVLVRTEYCTALTSAVSETNGVYNCKSCGPCCTP